jgi:hypothetical protein
MNATSARAKDILASLKSGVCLNGTVRAHSTDGAIEIARIAIELPTVGERQVLAPDEHNLQPGQKVVIQCVPNPLKPERYAFRIVEVLRPHFVEASGAFLPRSKNRGQRRPEFTFRSRVANKT